MKILTSSLVLLSLLTGSKAYADESAVPGASPQPVTASLVASSPPKPVVAMPIRPLLQEFSQQEGARRYGEGAVGLAGSGVLIGTGFAAAPHDRNWSYALWITGGVVALGSIGRLLIPTELEQLERSAGNLSEEQLRARWAELARARRLERRAGAVVGGLLGVTSVVLGALVLEGELGTLGRDPRRVVGYGLIGSGALGVVESAVEWFVPSPIEVGSALATSRPTLGMAVAPTRSGFALAVTGAF